MIVTRLDIGQSTNKPKYAGVRARRKLLLGFNRSIKSDSGLVDLMFIKQFPVALRPLTIILMLVMLLFATVADAATCGSEIATPDTVEMANSFAAPEASSDKENHDGQSSPAEQDGICGHGHCHVGSNIADNAQIDHIGHQLTLHGPTNASALVSSENILLKRPPRV